MRGCQNDRLIAWASSHLGGLGDPEAAGDALVYQSPCGPLVVTAGVEGGPFVGLWFSTRFTIWGSDVECARDAARELGCTVRCNPGQMIPVAAAGSPTFLELEDGRERLVEWL